MVEKLEIAGMTLEVVNHERPKPPEAILEAHKHSIRNKEEIQKSSLCGCFQCLEIFSPHEISMWIDRNDMTAQCPNCGIDSVIGDRSGFPIEKSFLETMKSYWFSAALEIVFSDSQESNQPEITSNR